MTHPVRFANPGDKFSYGKAAVRLCLPRACCGSLTCFCVILFGALLL